MNGCYLYNKITRNFRFSHLNYGESELLHSLRRHFSFSSQCKSWNELPFSFKPVLNVDYRRAWWYQLKSQCNEKLEILGEILTKQCNFIVSHRARRMSQVWNLYTYLYTEKTVGQIFSQFAKNLRSQKRPFSFLLGAVFFSWDKEKISDKEIENYVKTDNYLFDEMLYLRTCESICIFDLDRYRSSEDHPTKPVSGHRVIDSLVEDGWEAVIQKESIQVWRKSFPNSYLYEYKILGTFYDVPARTFFSVQTDIEYRKKWDKLVIKLDVIDKENIEGGCEVMHWVMHYPYPMYSREYVYIRRAVVDEDTNTMVLVSRSIDHPSIPLDKKYVRVTNYSSRMVIRPHRTYDDNGFDYVLTYFDDPQAAFPAPAYNWMASSGVPDFVEKLHNAAKELHYQQKKNISSRPTSKPNKPCAASDVEYIYM